VSEPTVLGDEGGGRIEGAEELIGDGSEGALTSERVDGSVEGQEGDVSEQRPSSDRERVDEEIPQGKGVGDSDRQMQLEGKDAEAVDGVPTTDSHDADVDLNGEGSAAVSAGRGRGVRGSEEEEIEYRRKSSDSGEVPWEKDSEETEEMSSGAESRPLGEGIGTQDFEGISGGKGLRRPYGGENIQGASGEGQDDIGESDERYGRGEGFRGSPRGSGRGIEGKGYREKGEYREGEGEFREGAEYGKGEGREEFGDVSDERSRQQEIERHKNGFDIEGYRIAQATKAITSSPVEPQGDWASGDRVTDGYRPNSLRQDERPRKSPEPADGLHMPVEQPNNLALFEEESGYRIRNRMEEEIFGIRVTTPPKRGGAPRRPVVQQFVQVEPGHFRGGREFDGQGQLRPLTQGPRVPPALESVEVSEEKVHEATETSDGRFNVCIQTELSLLKKEVTPFRPVPPGMQLDARRGLRIRTRGAQGARYPQERQTKSRARVTVHDFDGGMLPALAFDGFKVRAPYSMMRSPEVLRLVRMRQYGIRDDSAIWLQRRHEGLERFLIEAGREGAMVLAKPLPELSKSTHARRIAPLALRRRAADDMRIRPKLPLLSVRSIEHRPPDHSPIVNEDIYLRLPHLY
jgi:hypothetical protein